MIIHSDVSTIGNCSGVYRTGWKEMIAHSDITMIEGCWGVYELDGGIVPSDSHRMSVEWVRVHGGIPVRIIDSEEFYGVVQAGHRVPETPQDALAVTHRLIRDTGWVQGTSCVSGFNPGDAKYCVTGALYLVCLGAGEDQWCDLYSDAADLLGTALGLNGSSLIWDELADWNDNPNRTVEDVLDVLLRASSI